MSADRASQVLRRVNNPPYNADCITELLCSYRRPAALTHGGTASRWYSKKRYIFAVDVQRPTNADCTSTIALSETAFLTGGEHRNIDY